jgi:hypothetical protein
MPASARHRGTDQQALVIEEQISKCALKALGHKTNQVFCLSIGRIGISL